MQYWKKKICNIFESNNDSAPMSYSSVSKKLSQFERKLLSQFQYFRFCEFADIPTGSPFDTPVVIKTLSSPSTRYLSMFSNALSAFCLFSSSFSLISYLYVANAASISSSSPSFEMRRQQWKQPTFRNMFI